LFKPRSLNSPIIKIGFEAIGLEIETLLLTDSEVKQLLSMGEVIQAKIIVDDLKQAIHGGEINVPLSKGVITVNDVWAELSEIIVGLKPGREKREEITFYIYRISGSRCCNSRDRLSQSNREKCRKIH